MKPDIIEKPDFLVVGVRTLWDLSSTSVENLWATKVLPRKKEIKAAPGTESAAFGVFGAIPGSPRQVFEYVAGMMVLTLEDIPEGMVSWEIPGGMYASTTVQGLAAVYPAYRELVDKWLPTSGYEFIDGPAFTMCANITKLADSGSLWQVNVQVRNPGMKSEIDTWNI
jgi:Uncharacterized protein conserved in bacteria